MKREGDNEKFQGSNNGVNTQKYSPAYWNAQLYGSIWIHLIVNVSEVTELQFS